MAAFARLHGGMRAFPHLIAACLVTAPATAESLRLHCRGTRTIIGDDMRAFRWVERIFDVNYGRGEVRDPEGRLLAAAISDEELRIEFELDGWPPGRFRVARIDRGSGSWVEEPAGEAPAIADRVVGTCFRFARGD
jgi:hypothetical protein